MKIRRAIFRSSEEEGLELLGRATVVHLASTGVDGRPVLRALHTVIDGDLLAFHGAPAGEKLEAIGRPAVIAAHEVVAEIPSWFLDPERACPATTYYVSAQAEGLIEEVTDRVRKARILQALMKKYQPEGGHAPIRSDDSLYAKAVAGLLVAGIRFDRLSCKAKLGQNRRPEERRHVLEQLWRRGGPGDARAVHVLARRFPEIAPSFLGAPGLRLSCGIDDTDLADAVALLDGAYWLEGIDRASVVSAIRASQAVVTAHDEATNELLAFARATSDQRVAWIYDVVVRSDRRRSGAGAAIMKLLLDHPAVRAARRVRLGTRDAAGFYRRLGFVEIDDAPTGGWRTIEMIRAATDRNP